MNPLDVNKLEREIKIHGVPIEYQKSVLCQCQNSNFGAARIDCPVCNGLSWRWLEPSITTIGDALYSGTVALASSNIIRFQNGFDQKNDLMKGRTVLIKSGTGSGQKLRIKSYDRTTRQAVMEKNWTVVPDTQSTYEIYETLKALITTRDSTKDRKEAGIWETGLANCTIPSEIIPSDMDKIIVVQDRVAINNEIFTKGSSYPNSVSKERLRYRKIILVEDVRTLDDVFTIGTDVDVDKTTGTILWSGEHVPATGVQYTVRYIAVPEYLIMKNAPRFRQDGDSNVAPHLLKILRLDRYTPSNSDTVQ